MIQILEEWITPDLWAGRIYIYIYIVVYSEMEKQIVEYFVVLYSQE